MMKKVLWIWLILSVSIFMTACSSNDSMKEGKEKSAGKYESSPESSISNDMAVDRDMFSDRERRVRRRW